MFFLTHLGVEGFVVYGWDLSYLGGGSCMGGVCHIWEDFSYFGGYSPYMTNLGDKSHIIIIRNLNFDGTSL